MKKCIRYIALLLALVTLLTAPVFADDYASPWVSILQYDAGTSTGNTLTFQGSGTMEFTLPDVVYMRHIQGVISANFSNLTDLTYSFTKDGTQYPLSLLDAGNGLYRFFSGGSVAQNSNKIYLHFTNTDSITSTTLEVVSFEYSSLRFFSYAETGTLLVGSESHPMSTPNSVVTHYWDAHTSGQFIAHLSCTDWLLYDSLDFFVCGYGPDINSIVARFNNAAVPVTVTYLDAANWEDSRYSMMISLDLTGIDRSVSGYPEIEISGYRRTSDSQYYLSLLGVTGKVFMSDNSELGYLSKLTDYLYTLFNQLAIRQNQYMQNMSQWNADMYSLQMNFFRDITSTIEEGLSNIDSRFNDVLTNLTDFRRSMNTRIDNLQTALVDKLTGFQSSMESLFDELLHADRSGSELFEDDIASQATEFEDISETLDSVTKPAIDDIDPSVDDIVSPADVSNYTSILAVFFQNQIFLSVCLMSLTFALVSYTVYGKR